MSDHAMQKQKLIRKKKDHNKIKSNVHLARPEIPRNEKHLIQ